MTFEGLGEMFEDDFADMCTTKKFALVDGGLSGPVKGAQTGSEDPYRSEWEFACLVGQKILNSMNM